MELGTISFQTNDKMDIFYVSPVVENDTETSDETMLKIEDPQFESQNAWVTGNVPRMKSINVEGDTTTINVLYKGQPLSSPYEITVYLECELEEELQAVTADEEDVDEKQNKSDLEPVEINL